MKHSKYTKKIFRRPKNPVTLKRLALAFAITLVAAFIYVKVYPYTHDAKETRRLENTVQQLKQQKNQVEQIKAKTEQENAQQQQQIQELNKQLEEKERQLQAKRRTAIAYAASLGNSGSCADWMAQAGIPSTYATNKLILNESGCRPNAVNPSSGACGIPQALPCSKMNCSLSDPVCQLRWMDQYVKSTYGTWENALAKWNSRYPHWY